MDRQPDTDQVTSMEVSADQPGALSSPDAQAIASLGSLLGQRVHEEVREYTAALGRLVDRQRAGVSCHEAAAATAGGDPGVGGDGNNGGALLEPCCAVKLLRMHVLMAEIDRALDAGEGEAPPGVAGPRASGYH